MRLRLTNVVVRASRVRSPGTANAPVLPSRAGTAEMRQGSFIRSTIIPPSSTVVALGRILSQTCKTRHLGSARCARRKQRLQATAARRVLNIIASRGPLIARM